MVRVAFQLLPAATTRIRRFGIRSGEYHYQGTAGRCHLVDACVSFFSVLCRFLPQGIAVSNVNVPLSHCDG